MATKVHKALTPDEKLKLSNIMALCNELMGAEEAAATAGEDPIPVTEAVAKAEEEPADPPKEEQPKEEEVEKVKKSEEANQSAENRIEELPPDDEEALAVIKSLLQKSRQSVGKSKVGSTNELTQMTQVLGQSLAIMKSMQSRIDQQGQALSGILEGMGITEETLKVEKSAPKQAVQPSANDILQALASVVQKSAHTEPQKPETMKDVLTTLWGQ